MPIPDGTINRDAMCVSLENAIVGLEQLVNDIQKGEYDDDECLCLSPLGIQFEYVLSSLCYAWHSKWMSDKDLDSIDLDMDMLHTIPNWTLNFNLVDVGEPEKYDMRIKESDQ